MEENTFRMPIPRTELNGDRLSRPGWRELKVRNPELLWLDKNENTDPVLRSRITSVVHQLPAWVYSTYPEARVLYEKLALALDLTADQVLLTSGSDGAIRSVFDLYIERGDKVVITSPTFAMYDVYCRMYGAQIVPLNYEPSPSGPILDLERVVFTIRTTQPRLVCLPNPDSPTGSAFDLNSLRQIVMEAGRCGAVMLVDEAYFPFLETTAIPLLAECEHLVIARTFAKAWGMAGFRIGYAVANSPMIKALNQVRSMYETSSVAVAVAERMLDYESEMLGSVGRLQHGKEYFLSQMESLGLPVIDTFTNFVHVRFGESKSRILTALDGVALIRDLSHEKCLAGFTRFSLAPMPQLEGVVEVIRRALQ
jgi:histidinol-phosphate aminotransferase